MSETEKNTTSSLKEGLHKAGKIAKELGEAAIEVASTVILYPTFKLGSEIVKRVYNIDVIGKENLDKLPKDQRVIFAANHIGPVAEEGRLSLHGLDSLILNGVIEHCPGREPLFVAINKSDWLENAELAKTWYGNFLHKILPFEKVDGEPDRLNPSFKRIIRTFGKNVMKGAGTLPVDKNEKPELRDFVVDATAAAKEKDLVFYVEGDWSQAERNYTTAPLDAQPGAAHFSLKSGNDVVPMYIHCGAKFSTEGRPVVVIGEPISPFEDDGHTKRKSKATISAQIEASVAVLQQQALQKYPHLLDVPQEDTGKE